MEKIRKPFQGVLNIIRFNWHFYVIALAVILLSIVAANYLGNSFKSFVYIISVLMLGSIIISLLASLYIYDRFGLYNLKWIDRQNTESLVVNISAGFDETSALLRNKFSNAEFIVLDFYDPTKHTEISIKRARKAYPAFPETKRIQTIDLQLSDSLADKIFVILSAHEIRNENERITFFKELRRAIKPAGQIYITEHLRDVANFLVYNIGFFHFYSKRSWLKTFRSADLKVTKEIKLTPFISTFILNKNGNTL